MITLTLFLRSRYLLASLLLLCGLYMVWMPTAHAHQSSTAYLHLSKDSTDQPPILQYRLALRDLATLLPLDANQDQQITWQELSSQQRAVNQLLHDQIRLSSAGAACTLSASEPLLIEQVAGQNYVVQPLQTSCTEPDQLDYRILKDIDSNHRLLLTTQQIEPSRTQTQLIAPSVIELSAASHSWFGTAQQFVLEGVHHLLIGADHVLFLFCILLPAVYQPRTTRQATFIPVEYPSNTIRQVVYVATAFTLAHSVTLTLAALQIVQLPAQWVESVIAGSIMVAALMNLFGTQRRQIGLAFVFGLIHGFGFANVLSDLPLQPLERVVALLSFNLGIELGQLLCILLFMPFALWLRHSGFYRWGIFTLGSGIAAIIALLWMLQRVFEWSLIAG
ncbi:MAG: HupE/UreJ family protein [Pseudomonadota bacterium]|nr:HupE/UreJ family protein [Pseudomonadota bacterium]